MSGKQVTPCIHYRNSQTQLQSVFEMFSVCPDASSKTWSPVADRFIDEHLLEVLPLNSIRHNFSWSTSWIRLW